MTAWMTMITLATDNDGQDGLGADLYWMIYQKGSRPNQMGSQRLFNNISVGVVYLDTMVFVYRSVKLW